ARRTGRRPGGGRGRGRRGGGRAGGGLGRAVRLAAEVDDAGWVGLAVGVADGGDDRALGLLRVVEGPRLVDGAVAVRVAMALPPAVAVVVVLGVDLLVEVGLAELEVDLTVLVERDPVGEAVAIEVLLAASFAALVVVVDERVGGAVHVQVDHAADLSPAL